MQIMPAGSMALVFAQRLRRELVIAAGAAAGVPHWFVLAISYDRRLSAASSGIWFMIS